jgi:hypothetical protein
MLQINSTTPLSVLFQSLQYASSEVDRRSLKKSLVESARLPLKPHLATLEAATAPHLTYYAQEMVQQQMAHQHIYQCTLVTSAGARSEHHVWDGRGSQVLCPEKRVVVAAQDYMQCSCNYPAVYLLPCRHVLALNVHLHRRPFWHGQVGQRWLRYHKPLIMGTGDKDGLTGPARPLFEGPIEMPNTSLQQAAPTLNSQSRFGMLHGYSMTICTRGAEFRDIFPSALSKMQEMARWIESVTSVPDKESAPSKPGAAPLIGPAPLSNLHPTVPISYMHLPTHKVRQPGRTKEKRQEASYEKAAKKVRMSLSASQKE